MLVVTVSKIRDTPASPSFVHEPISLTFNEFAFFVCVIAEIVTILPANVGILDGQNASVLPYCDYTAREETV